MFLATLLSLSWFTRRNLFLGEGPVAMGRVLAARPVSNHNSTETGAKQAHSDGASPRRRRCREEAQEVLGGLRRRWETGLSRPSGACRRDGKRVDRALTLAQACVRTRCLGCLLPWCLHERA